MSITVQTLDARHKAYPVYKYRVGVGGLYGERQAFFIQLRNWCWDTWGASAELDLSAWVNLSYHPAWCWDISKVSKPEKYWIYLEESEHLSHFNLKWG